MEKTFATVASNGSELAMRAAPRRPDDDLWKRGIAAILLATFATTAGAFDFKGLVLGESTTPSQVEDRLAVCVGYGGKPCDDFQLSLNERGRVKCSAGHQGSTVCNGITTVAGFSTSANIVIGSDGILRRVLLSGLKPDDFNIISDELSAKFGVPISNRNSVAQNGYGAQFQQIEQVWSDTHDQRIEFKKYAGSSTRSSLYFSTRQDREILNAPRGIKGDL